MKKTDKELEATLVNCDVCGNQETVDSMDFIEVCNVTKGKGWRTRKFDGKYYDFCCDRCFESYVRKNAVQLDPRFEPTARKE